LCIEVTESALLLDTDHAITNLTALAELGVAVSLDDFGTGFSSLSYLQRLPLAELKIDRSFVNRIGNRDGRAIAGAVIAMAGALDLHTVAEGVELPVQARLLQELGCSGAQGYLFARSMPLDQALATDSYGVSWS
jgi:EAL domain-containing protein (putative c-di-GMP-specific phosphodiesterase class I)